jgi:hypothetical protein
MPQTVRVAVSLAGGGGVAQLLLQLEPVVQQLQLAHLAVADDQVVIQNSARLTQILFPYSSWPSTARTSLSGSREIPITV